MTIYRGYKFRWVSVVFLRVFCFLLPSRLLSFLCVWTTVCVSLAGDGTDTRLPPGPRNGRLQARVRGAEGGRAGTPVFALTVATSAHPSSPPLPSSKAALFQHGDDASTQPPPAQQAPPAPPPRTTTLRGARLPPTSIGHRLLVKAGWREGQGLGVHNQGNPEPVAPAPQAGAAGVGAPKRLRAADASQPLPPQPPPSPPPVIDTATRTARATAAADAAARARISRALTREFDDGGAAADANPLTTGGRRRGRGANPLL